VAGGHLFRRGWKPGIKWLARKPGLCCITPHYAWAAHDTPKTLTKLNNLPNLEKAPQSQPLNIIFSYQGFG